MPNKRYTPPDAVLMRVIRGLESDIPRHQADAVLTLLRRGPLTVSETLLTQEQPAPIGLVRAELLAFLRALVRGQSSWIASDQGVGFVARMVDGTAQCAIERGLLRDVVIQQLITLLHLVGLEALRTCPAPSPDAPPGTLLCNRLFIKSYGQKFCSPTCQKRIYMRQRRENERRAREKHLQRRRAARRSA